MTGWRVSDNQRTKKIGIAANDFETFRRKACEKLQKNFNTCKYYVAENGTLVEDNEYFFTLKPQTLFILIDNNETIITDIELEFNKCLPSNYIETSEKVKEFFRNNPELLQNMVKKVGSYKFNDKMLLSKKEEDMEWFLGIEKYNSKEEYMVSRAKHRIKSYLIRAKGPINKRDENLNPKNPTERKIKIFWDEINHLLKTDDYHGNYFNRKADGDKYCDQTGNFVCEGKWNEKKCNESEVINPYNSKEERTLFKCWNLDHGIELSRAIVPSIIKAIEKINISNFSCCKCGSKSSDGYIDTKEYYKLLFTRYNLKLVSDFCHDKCKHQDLNDIYVICNSCKLN